MIGHNVARDVKMGNPVCEQRPGARLCRNDGDCHNLRPVCEAVHNCQHIMEGLGDGQMPNQVIVQVLKASTGQKHLANRGGGVKANLGTLTVNARVGPLCYVFLCPPPYISACDHGLGRI